MIRVYIATTAGPVAIQRISKEDPVVRSVVCLNGTSQSLPISRAYDGFVRNPTGVVERSFGHSAFRVDVDRAITDGNSWQLGLFVAHALAEEGRLAGPEDKVENVIWLSGELDRDLNVRPVRHIEEKLNASRALFDQLLHEDIRLFCFIPAGDYVVPDDVLEDFEMDGKMRHLESLRDLRRLSEMFSLPDFYQILEDEEDDDLEEDEDDTIDLYKNDPHHLYALKDNPLVRMGVIFGLVLALGIGLYMQFQDTIRALRGLTLEIGISELRADPENGCKAPQRLPLKADGKSFPASPLEGLCALEITLHNSGTPAHMWVFAQRLSDGHMLLADRETLKESRAQKGLIGWRLVLPDSLRTSIDYRIIAMASPYPLMEPVERLLRAQFGASGEDWKKIQDRLAEEKDISVVSALHSLTQD